MKNKNSSVFFAKIHPLEKLINNILTTKVVIITKKLFYLKQKKSSVFLKGFTQLENFIKFNLCRSVILNTKKISCWGIFRGRDSLTGFTLIEALIVIAIIGIMSVFYVINLRPDTLELLRMDSTRLAADIRYIRSMAATRAVYNGSFPVGGYGIVLQNGNGTTNKSYYRLYAGDENNVIKTVYLSDPAFRLVDSNSLLERSAAVQNQDQKKFVFLSENNISASGLALSATSEYQIEIYYDFTKNNQNYYYIARLDLGRKTADDFIWSNLAVTYETDTPDCGNKVVESGEVCEPIDLAGNFNSNCTPECQLNVCGDGYILGTEQCEFSQTAQTDRGLFCSINFWCQACTTAGENTGTCTVFDSAGQASSVPCCNTPGPVNLRCNSCVLVSSLCPTVCPDGDIES